MTALITSSESTPISVLLFIRKHATLKIVNGELFVKDLSSTNGTFVNNIMIPPHTETHLQRGDCVAFGYKGDTKPKPGNHVENICTPIK